MSTGIWTNNWTGYKNTMILGYNYPGLATLIDMKGSRMSYFNNNYITLTASPFASIKINTSSSQVFANGYNIIYVGSGGKEPAAEDFSLENRLTSITYLSAASEEITWSTANRTATRKMKLMVQNQTTSSMTIREWGLFKALLRPSNAANEQGTSQSMSSSGDYFMLYREVLDTPITLPASQSATLELTLSITLADPI